MRTSAEDIGAIYFANAAGSGLTKIGFALDVRDRLHGLNVGSPVKITLVSQVLATRAAEKALHQVLKAHRVKGEWYDENLAYSVLDGLGEILAETGVAQWDCISIDSLGEALDAAFLTREAILGDSAMLSEYDPEDDTGD